MKPYSFKYPILFLLICLINSSCQFEVFKELHPDTENAKIVIKAENFDELYSSNRPDQDPINVIYFIPTDFVEEYDKINTPIRVSEAMLFAQKWYEKQMELNGFGKKTFALSVHKNGKWVGVIPVYGSKASTEYANNAEVKAEIMAFFANNPNLWKGEHSMVVSNEGTGFNNASNGRMAFSRSPDDFTMKTTGLFIKELELLTCEKYGTLIHELGHALNAPHVAHVASQSPSRSIMGGGGANLWDAGGSEDKLILVPSSAAIFDVSEAFNPSSDGIDYYAVNPTFEFKEYSIVKDDGKSATLARFKFISDVLPKHLYVAYDALPARVNDDYDKVSFTTKVIATGKPNEYLAELEMPYAEFFNYFNDVNKTGNGIQLTANVLFENGIRSEVVNYDFTINTAPIPDDNINSQFVDLTDRSGWTVSANTFNTGNVSQQPASMIDGDRSSFWLSMFPYDVTVQGPHTVDVDMGEIQEFEGIYILSAKHFNPTFKPKHIVVEISTDGVVYEQVADQTEPIANSHVFVNFDETVNARFFRLKVDQTYRPAGRPENLEINELDIIVN